MTKKAELWRGRLEACRASGQSIARFCRAHELSYAQYMYWQRRLGGTRKGLVPVQVDAAATAEPRGLSVELSLPGEIGIHVQGARAADVVALIRGLSC